MTVSFTRAEVSLLFFASKVEKKFEISREIAALSENLILEKWLSEAKLKARSEASRQIF